MQPKNLNDFRSHFGMPLNGIPGYNAPKRPQAQQTCSAPTSAKKTVKCFARTWTPSKKPHVEGVVKGSVVYNLFTEMSKNLGEITPASLESLKNYIQFTSVEPNAKFEAQSIFKRVNRLVGPLHGYVISHAVSLFEMSDKFLLHWARSLEWDIQRNIRLNQEILCASNKEKRHLLISNEIVKIANSIKWPRFPERGNLLLKLRDELKSPFAKEILWICSNGASQSEAVPLFYEKLKGLSSPDFEEQYLIEKYSQKEVSPAPKVEKTGFRALDIRTASWKSIGDYFETEKTIDGPGFFDELTTKLGSNEHYFQNREIVEAICKCVIHNGKIQRASESDEKQLTLFLATVTGDLCKLFAERKNDMGGIESENYVNLLSAALITIINDKRQSIPERDSLRNAVVYTIVVLIGKSKSERAQEFAANRMILKQLIASGAISSHFGQVLDAISFQLKKHSMAEDIDLKIAAFEHLMEIYVEVVNASQNTEFADAFLEESSNYLDVAGDHIPQLIACIFAVNHASMNKREEVLRKIFDKYSKLKSDEYPLGIFMLGSIDQDNLPEKHQRSLLLRHLKEYKGLFAEGGVSEAFKADIWKKFIEGDLCNNKYYKLAHTLNNLFEEANSQQKKEIIQAMTLLYEKAQPGDAGKILELLETLSTKAEPYGTFALDEIIKIKDGSLNITTKEEKI